MERLVLAPDVVIRYRGTAACVHTSTQPRPATFEDPRALLIVSGFRTPATADEVTAATEMDAGEARAVIATLVESGVLVSAARPAGGNADTPEHAAGLMSTYLTALADGVYNLAGDLAAFGPRCDGDLSAATGLGVVPRLQSILAGVDSLRNTLAGRRPAFLAGQLARLGIEDARDLKLHIGGGGHTLDGWINIDVFPAPLEMDVRWGLPFAAGAARYVFLSHMLEHLFYPGEALRLLRDLRRVVAADGTVRIIVPDIEQCLHAYVDDDKEFFESRRQTWTWWPEGQTRLEDFLAYAGAGPRPGYFFASHKFGYDFETLRALLERAGFTRVCRSAYQGSEDPALRVDDASLVAGATHGGTHYSLFVEAKP